MRIVSLLASGTEIVCGLGAGDDLVGRSHECDNPDWVKRLPVCTRPALDVEMSSCEINAEVSRRIRKKEPLYYIDAGLIARLNPDLLITQEHCDVCAVTPRDVARGGCEGLAEQVLALSAGSVRGIYDGVFAVAKAINRTAAARTLVVNMQQRIDRVRRAVQRKPAPTVVMLEWTDPIFPMGNWGPELVEAANGKLLLGKEGEHSQATSWARVREAESALRVSDANYQKYARDSDSRSAARLVRAQCRQECTSRFRRRKQILQPLRHHHRKDGGNRR